MELTIHDDWEDVDELMAKEELEISERELAAERWVVSE